MSQDHATRIIVITGAPGAGKTTVARALVERSPWPAALIETDAMAAIHPWRIDHAFHRLVGHNLRACLAGYREWGARIIVISGVVVPGGILDELAPILRDTALHCRIYGLQAHARELARRITGDPKPQDAAQRLQWLHLNRVIETIDGITLIDTTDMPAAAVVDDLCRREGLTPAPAVSAGEPIGPAGPTLIDVDIDTLERACRRALEAAGAPPAAAARVAARLLLAELEGYASHGVLRLPEYVHEMETGAIRARQEPAVTRVGPNVAVVDGRRAFGPLAADAVSATLAALLDDSPVAVVGLRNSAHIGRLAHLARPLLARGHIVLGFANYLGAGQKVPPWGCQDGRLCTNPILAAFPGQDGAHVEIDLTTSAVSEGKVRSYAQRGRNVPPGWLVDTHGDPVLDPAQLYTDPPRARLAPLGDGVGYKGSLLGILCEILAGVLCDNPFAQAEAGPGGNGGLFIGLSADVLGSSEARVRQGVDALLRHCASATPVPGHDGFRAPGQRPRQRAAAARQRGRIDIPAALWEHIAQLAGA